MTVEEAVKKFPEEAGIARFGKPEEIADLLAYMVSPRCEVDDRSFCADGRRRNQRHLICRFLTAFALRAVARRIHKEDVCLSEKQP